MPKLESFRVEVLSEGQSLSNDQLSKRIDRFIKAIHRLLLPLKLGKRLMFRTETDEKILWLVVNIDSSGQMGLYSEHLDSEEDPELGFEVASSQAYMARAIRDLRELMQLGRLTAAALERFTRSHLAACDDLPGISLLDVGLKEKSRINVQNAQGHTLLLDCTDLPRQYTSEAVFQIDFYALSVGENMTSIKVTKDSKRFLESEKYELRLFYSGGSTGKEIRARLFAGMESKRRMRCNVRCTRSLLGWLHSVYAECGCDLTEAMP